MDYESFIQSKLPKTNFDGFDVEERDLNSRLMDFQKHLVAKAVKIGRYALFEDCGLGKTFQQLEWARIIAKKTNSKVIILCPLAVVGQTIEEGVKWGIDVVDIKTKERSRDEIYITNYEQIDNINEEDYTGVVLDESSILKNFTGKMRNELTNKFYFTKYKLCCTATPAPNDPNELGNHSQFLNILDAQDMRSRWFVRDEGMNNYRLKGHAVSDFYSWVSSWATMISKPSDIGFEDDGFLLPPLEFYNHRIETQKQDNGMLFNSSAVSATDFNRELRRTITERCECAAKIVNGSKESFIIWCNQNSEEEMLKKLIPDSVCVRGADKPEYKKDKLLGFAHDNFRVLITKKKIAQFGLNYQNCHNQIFVALDFSFEGLYQAIRRCYRFGQKEQVNIHLISTDTMQNVVDSVERKEKEFAIMKSEMNKKVTEHERKLTSDYVKIIEERNEYKMIHGDSVVEIKNIDSNSVDFSIFSPPFSNLFTYSDNIRDMGNCVDDKEFFKQTDYLLPELYRVIKNGRLVAVHTKDIPRYKNSSGYSGMYDFTGDYHRAMERAGFKYHCKVTVWTDPVYETTRTKTQRLLYKQVRSDSGKSGVGMPEYVTVFKKREGTSYYEQATLVVCTGTRLKSCVHLRKRGVHMDTMINHGDVLTGNPCCYGRAL